MGRIGDDGNPRADLQVGALRNSTSASSKLFDSCTTRRGAEGSGSKTRRTGSATEPGAAGLGSMGVRDLRLAPISSRDLRLCPACKGNPGGRVRGPAPSTGRRTLSGSPTFGDPAAGGGPAIWFATLINVTQTSSTPSPSSGRGTRGRPRLTRTATSTSTMVGAQR